MRRDSLNGDTQLQYPPLPAVPIPDDWPLKFQTMINIIRNPPREAYQAFTLVSFKLRLLVPHMCRGHVNKRRGLSKKSRLHKLGAEGLGITTEYFAWLTGNPQVVPLDQKDKWPFRWGVAPPAYLYAAGQPEVEHVASTPLETDGDMDVDMQEDDALAAMLEAELAKTDDEEVGEIEEMLSCTDLSDEEPDDDALTATIEAESAEESEEDDAMDVDVAGPGQAVGAPMSLKSIYKACDGGLEELEEFLDDGGSGDEEMCDVE